MITLRFLDNYGPVAWAIKAFTWSQISHVEFVFQDGYLGAVAPDGVKLRPFDYTKPKKEWFGTVECTDEQAAKIKGFARAQIGKPYDYLQILGIVLHKDGGNNYSWFCSELVFASFANAGILLLDRDPQDRITPYDIFSCALVKVTSC